MSALFDFLLLSGGIYATFWLLSIAVRAENNTPTPDDYNGNDELS